MVSFAIPLARLVTLATAPSAGKTALPARSTAEVLSALTPMISAPALSQASSRALSLLLLPLLPSLSAVEASVSWMSLRTSAVWPSTLPMESARLPHMKNSNLFEAVTEWY